MSTAPQTEPLQATDLDEAAINTIRLLAVDAVEKAQSGHAGMPMGMAPTGYLLYTKILRHDPADPYWFNRDRFVLSTGHGSMLLYALLHLSGYDLPMEELKAFRQWGSKTPGHPERDQVHVTPGVETTTGPLGQGFANAVGMAMAERFMAARFNRDGFPVVDHYTYGICSDGDLMEGVSHEAASLAGHLGLGKLIFYYDDNEVSIDGSTDLAFTEDVAARFEAYGWHVQQVEDANDLAALDRATQAAQAETGRPSIICVHSIIGYGAPDQGSPSLHSDPLGEEAVAQTKRNLGFPEDETFYVPDGVYDHMRRVDEGEQAKAEWEDLMKRFGEEHPDEAAELKQWISGTLPDGWDSDLPTFEVGDKLATRAASGKVLEALGPKLPFLIGGSADLTPSNKTAIKGREDFQKATPNGAYFHFGVREHAMASVCNGIALHGGLIPYCGTFLVFSDYARPGVRLSALMGTRVLYVFTHDSVGLGEDGPTHQPIAHVMSLRAIPDLVVMRPADAAETVEAWKYAIEHADGPVAFALTRQGVPTLDRQKYASAENLRRGGYVLRDTDGTPDVIVIATGSEVHISVEAAETLAGEGVQVRVVSVPSWELFDAQPKSYRDEVLPPDVTKRVSVEAGVTMGWERYVGLQGRMIGIDRFGASAPGTTVLKKFGFTAEHVAEVVREVAG